MFLADSQIKICYFIVPAFLLVAPRHVSCYKREWCLLGFGWVQFDSLE